MEIALTSLILLVTITVVKADQEETASQDYPDDEAVEILRPGHEFRLLRDLMTEYDPAARPVKTKSDVVYVKMGVALFQIRELDEKNQFLQINAWFQFHWTDPHLAWNSSEYGGLAKVHIPSSRIWVPDVVLYNSVDETKPATEVFPETHAIVSSEGKVLWVIPAMTKSSCKIDVTYFPFDEQRCPLKFGSWTYDGFQMDLVNLSESGDLTKYTVSGEWDLVGMPARRNVEKYSCCIEPYVDVTYTVVMRRKPMFFTYNLVFPCVLLMGIGILVFCLPPESGEKVSLSVTVLLAMTVYQLLIAETIPATSEVVPLIGQFFGTTIFLLSLSSAMTVVIMKLHFSGEHGDRVPAWLRKVILDWLARCVRMHIDESTDNSTARMSEIIFTASSHASKRSSKCAVGSVNKMSKTAGRLNSATADLLLLQHNSDLDAELDISMPSGSPYQRRPAVTRRRQCNIDAMDPSDRSDCLNILCELASVIGQINSDLSRNNKRAHKEELRKSEWRKVALVLDRLLLITFFVITCLACTAIFANVPR